MEIKLKLSSKYDAVELHQLLGNEKIKYVNDNYRHLDMIELLEGSNSEKGLSRLDAEKHSMRMNNKQIAFIDNIMSQLESYVEQYFKSR